jgi:translation initiation factor 4E
MEQELKDVKPMPMADIPRDVIKHPLQNSWTLWYFENDRAKNWEDNQVEIYNFDTVEDFWA